METVEAESSLGSIERQYWSDRLRARAEALTWLDQLGSNDAGPISRRLELVVVSVDHTQGDAAQGAMHARQALDWAVAHADRAVQARCHRFLSSVFRRVGEPGLALEHAVSANDLLDDDQSPIVHAAARLCLADALGAAGSYDESQRRYTEAAQLIDDDGLPLLRLAILNNSAFTYHMAHQTNEALAAVDVLLRTSAARHLVLGMSERDTVARVLVVAGRFAEAERVLAPAMAPLTAFDDPDGFAMGNVTLAEVCRHLGALDRAQAAIDRGYALCRRYGLAQAMAEFAREQAEVFAAGNSYQNAFEKYREYHTRSVALGADRQDARGRVFEAVFRTTEDRLETARYRELAERDPLTGLYNRRYIDEYLAHELVSALGVRAPLVVAMLDLDHFKQINDLRSHQVGDDVLRVLGKILTECAEAVPGGVAARLGGEEFVLVLPLIDADATPALMESVRRAISEYAWHPLTSGLNVTASIGAAIAPIDGIQGSALLHIADARLYLAKDQGRNRCVVTGGLDVDPVAPPASDVDGVWAEAVS